jgi:phosphatidylglycerophosphate synthase
MPTTTAPIQTLSTFSRAHSLIMGFAAAASLWMESAWPAVALGAASLIANLILHRGSWTADGRLGLANAVTLLRLALTVVMVPLAVPSPGPGVALLVLFIFTLDGVDGWLARRGQTASLFGALFDMECDALLVLVCALVLYQYHRLGAFILIPGLLRYVYVTALMFAPSLDEAPPSRLGRSAFSLMMTSFIASLWPVEPVHGPLAIVAACLIVYSFARSVLWAAAKAASARPAADRGREPRPSGRS